MNRASGRRPFPGLLASAMLLLAIVSCPSEGATAAREDAAPDQGAGDRHLAQGLSVEMSVRPAAASGPSDVFEGDDAELSFRITDASTGAPVPSLYPAAWLDLRQEAEDGATAAGTLGCREKIRMFTRGIVGFRPMIDLTSYYILALNKDATISVIDPIVGIGGLTQLYTQILLPKPGEDWANSADRMRLYVTMPRAGRVAVVDTDSFKVVANVEAGSYPVRVALQPDGRYVWVGNDAPGKESGVTVIDADNTSVAARIPTGAGHHELALSPDSRYAFVTNRDAGSMSVIDIRKLAKIKDVDTGGRPLSVAYSPIAKALYVADETGGGIAVVDGERHEVVARVPGKPGLRAVRFTDDGRWAFAVNALENTVQVVDASTHRVTHTVAVGATPDQVTFSKAFAYIRALGSEYITMIPLSELGKAGPLSTKTFATGTYPPGRAPYIPIADAIVPTPEQYAVAVTNPAEKTIFYYMEGMTAPSGNFRNYGHDPMAAMVVDRSLRERKPGVYSARVRIPLSGTYDLAFFLESPRIVHCFAVTVKPNPRLTKPPEKGLRLEYLSPGPTVAAGVTTPLRIRISDRATNSPVTDLMDVVVQYSLASGGWNRRETATHRRRGRLRSAASPLAARGLLRPRRMPVVEGPHEGPALPVGGGHGGRAGRSVPPGAEAGEVTRRGPGPRSRPPVTAVPATP